MKQQVYTKIIPRINNSNPIESAKLLSDCGADEIAYFDTTASKEGREANIETIKEISRIVDVPIVACGGVRRFEDVKKMLYAGAAKVCIKSAAMNNPDIVKEASERFGSERIVITIDLNDVKDPVKYATDMVALGAGELLILENTKKKNYIESVVSISQAVNVPVIIQSFSDSADEMASLIKKTEAASISLYSDNINNVMDIKQTFIDNNIIVNTFESALDFDEFKTDSNGLVPCVVQDYKTSEVLMMAYMNKESFNKTIKSGMMTYYSRSRSELWTKGETSGHFQYVKSLSIDCDKDTILAKVSQVGAACHTGNRTCFFTDLVKKEYDDTNPLSVFNDVYGIIADRKVNPKEGSYTNYLFDKGIDKILKKVGEEATEIVIAAKNPDSEELKYEISDFMYHVMVLMVERGLDWNDIIKELADRR